MFKTFLWERLSWILLFIFMQFLLLVMGYLDPKLSFSSVLYIIFLFFIVFLIFLVIRWKRETNFYRKLKEWEDYLDITEVPEAETPLQQIVETCITTHTEQLQEKVTRHELAMEQEKDDLLSWIHEVKTPLTAMHLMINRIHDYQLKSLVMYEWLRIHLLLDQQLHKKRMPSMENDIHFETVDLQSVISQEVKMLQTWCMQKKIGFEIILEQADVLSDAKWLAFILRQLFTNAVKYSEFSDIEITSRIVNEQVVLKVKDHGRGIASKDMPRIFDKGFTSTRNHRDHAASGMGLYLAKKAAETLLIKIEVKSKVGVGTAFILTFPNKNDFIALQSM